MGKITKKQLQESHNKLLNQFASLVRELKVNNVIDDSVCPTFTKKTEPQLKQLDQSVFEGLDEKWRFAAVDANGRAHKYEQRPDNSPHGEFLVNINEYSCDYELIGKGYDASNWQNSLIKRDIAKELLEVDLSSELTGSELCRAMLARGDKYILCLVGDGGDYRVANQGYAFIVTGVHSNGEFDTPIYTWEFAVPINNQGEPLTQAEAGL